MSKINQDIDNLEFEHKAKAKGFRFIFGIDEAGRGPLAGPVVAAAVYLTSTDFENRVTDSKKMTPKQRDRAFEEICQKAYFGIGVMNEIIIDKNNILNATFLAMAAALRNAVKHLPDDIIQNPDFAKQTHLLVDGNRLKGQIPYSYETIVDGDSKSLSISCASIIAKVYRDRMITVYDQIYSQYGFAKHKGYGTKQHREAIKEYGLSPIHRRSFQLKG